MVWVAELFDRKTRKRIYRWEHDTWDILAIPHKLRAHFQITSLVTDAGGCLWTGTDTQSAWRYDTDGWQRYPGRMVFTRDGLPGGEVYRLLVDQQQRIWSGSYSLGVCEQRRWHMA